MRLWHIDLIENNLLAKSQLLAQWRELNSIFKKQDKHILINYIYDYDKIYLWNYSLAVVESMNKRNYKITEKSKNNLKEYFKDLGNIFENNYTCKERFKEHNDKYLLICFMNLYEKYIRGQKDFTSSCFQKLYNFVREKFDLYEIFTTK